MLSLQTDVITVHTMQRELLWGVIAVCARLRPRPFMPPSFTPVLKLLPTEDVRSLLALYQLQYRLIVPAGAARHDRGTDGGHDLCASSWRCHFTPCSTFAQEYINSHLGSGRVRVDAILYAPPNAGDDEFNEILSHTVNVRSLVFKYDLVPQLPCSPQMMACPNTPVDTTDGLTVQSWSYSPGPGLLLLNASNMPFQEDAWASFSKLDLKDTTSFLSATHGCSYLCATSQYVGDPDNWCLLTSEAAGTANATFCPEFPVDQDFPFPLELTHVDFWEGMSSTAAVEADHADMIYIGMLQEDAAGA